MWKSDKSQHQDGQRGHRGSRAMKCEWELATPRRHCRWGRTWPFFSWPKRVVGTSCKGLALPWKKSVSQPTWTECLLETIPNTATTLDSCRPVKTEFTKGSATSLASALATTTSFTHPLTPYPLILRTHGLFLEENKFLPSLGLSLLVPLSGF